MATSTKRKTRKKLAKTEDLLEPFDITKFGSTDDPCFGTQFDPTHEACRSCGDAEFCSITQMYKLDLKRKVAEAEGDFKDLHEDKYQKDPRNIIIDRLRRAEGKWVSYENLKKELRRKGLKVKEITTLENNGFFNKLKHEECIKLHKSEPKYKFQ